MKKVSRYLFLLGLALLAYLLASLDRGHLWQLGKMGDFLKIVTLHQEAGGALSHGISAAVERILNSLALALLSAIGLLYVSATFSLGGGVWLSLAPVTMVALVLFLATRQVVWQKGLGSLAARLGKPLLQGRLGGVEGFYDAISLLQKRPEALVIAFLLLSTTWLLTVVREFLLSQALKLPVDFGYFLLVSPVVAVVTLMPISVMGVGTRDYTLILLLGTLGISQEAAVSLSLLMVGIVTLPMVAAGSLVAWKQRLAAPPEVSQLADKTERTWRQRDY
ncbi:MAG: flippase-like domain-containing protein [Chloroflexi bacterium]|nr:flippase-like domain-containing protein [Chloroflexota bacterium]